MSEGIDASSYVAELIMGRSEGVQEHEPQHTMTIRLPLSMAARIIEMAHATDQSRVEIARLLLQAGLDSVFSKLPIEVQADLAEAVMEREFELAKGV